jgi:molybdenum cofactor cytidylyltransferase
MKTALVILAAGSSSRMGSAKQLLSYQGKPLIRHAAETALASICRPVIVVLGANAASIRHALINLDLTVVENPRWEEGMGTSIGVGLREAQARGAEAVLLALADQPFITSEIYNDLVAQCESTGKPIVTSQYAGTVGVPVLFRASHFQPLLDLPAAQGCKGVILAHGADALRIPCPEAEMDVDTPADYQLIAN